MPVDASLLHQQLTQTLDRTTLQGFEARYEGKVRDTYRIDDRLILVTTDRISAFDHILKQTIPFKGQVLNQLAAFFFEQTADLVPNHILKVPDPNVTIARRCTPVPIEFVVRGYLAGHAWRTYNRGLRTLCGQPLPEGLREGSRLPRPLLTPATKAEEGHDEDITRAEVISRGLLDEDVFDQLETYALRLFERGSELAARQGLILVDTKYEFGLDPHGHYRLIDEIHTPDSSRYYYQDGYEERLANQQPQRQLSKEFVREWLMENDFMGHPGQQLPDLPDAFRVEIAQRYIELFERVSGQSFIPDTTPPLTRLEKLVLQ
ncbi:MAG: phosphoribosylaminoimidazolesuccinocarboxamide synthase [Bacteroidota bacterium]